MEPACTRRRRRGRCPAQRLNQYRGGLQLAMRQRLVVLMVLIAMACAAPARAEIKLAYVDIQRALNECNAGKRAKVQIRGKVDEVTGRLKRQQAEVQSLQDELQKKGALM